MTEEPTPLERTTRALDFMLTAYITLKYLGVDYLTATTINSLTDALSTGTISYAEFWATLDHQLESAIAPHRHMIHAAGNA